MPTLQTSQSEAARFWALKCPQKSRFGGHFEPRFSRVLCRLLSAKRTAAGTLALIGPRNFWPWPKPLGRIHRTLTFDRGSSSIYPLLARTGGIRPPDLIGGSGNSYVATLVERHSRYVMLVKVANKDTESVVTALIRSAQRLTSAVQMGWMAPAPIGVVIRHSASILLRAPQRVPNHGGQYQRPTRETGIWWHFCQKYPRQIYRDRNLGSAK